MIGFPWSPLAWDGAVATDPGGGGGGGVTPPPDPVPVVAYTREVPAYTNVSVVRIANIALQRVGATQPIAALDEPSKEARVIRQVWDHLRDLTLQELGWGFARAQAYLAPVSVTFRPWAYCYRLPSDCLKPVQVLPVGGVTARAQRVPYGLASDAGGPLVCTDVPEAVLEYIARLVDPNDWPAWFHEHLACALAVEIAMPLTMDARVKASAMADFERSRRLAAQSNASSDEAPPMDEVSAFVMARGAAVVDQYGGPR